MDYIYSCWSLFPWLVLEDVQAYLKKIFSIKTFLKISDKCKTTYVKLWTKEIGNLDINEKNLSFIYVSIKSWFRNIFPTVFFYMTPNSVRCWKHENIKIYCYHKHSFLKKFTLFLCFVKICFDTQVLKDFIWTMQVKWTPILNRT